MGVNTFSTIVLLTLITNCDGGALLATQHTHICLIFCLILRATTEQTAAQCVPYTTRARHNITLLACCQSAILSSNEWHNDMNPVFISTIMAPNFEIKEITSGTRRDSRLSQSKDPAPPPPPGLVFAFCNTGMPAKPTQWGV